MRRGESGNHRASVYLETVLKDTHVQNENEQKRPNADSASSRELEQLAMRLQELADSKDTPHGDADTEICAEGLDTEAKKKLETIQSVVHYVERIAGLASVVNQNESETELGSFGRFKLLSQCGAGGFARVYLAHDPNLDRLVALKIPHLKRLSSNSARLRFEREARAAALLSHPSIVPIFEAGTEDSVAYIASEFCAGETLSEWIQRQDGPSDPRFACTLVATLADAMQYSHLRGIVHRDLKPSNVMLAKADDEGGTESFGDESHTSLASTVRILDFGLAKPIFEEEDGDLTQDGELVGTPAYMAPELVSGDDATPKSDIYSLGVILYLLLTGKLPHTGKTTLELLKSLEAGTLTAPRRHNPSIHPDLEAIAMKCLRKDSADRYDDALQLHDDLENWLHARPVIARPATLFEQTRMWYRREPKFANALLLATAILFAGITGTAWQFRKAVLYQRDAEAAMLEAKHGQEEIAASLAKNARVAVSMFDEYGKIDQWLADNPGGDGLREKVQLAVDQINESDGKADTRENWMGLTDKQMTMAAGLAVMMLTRDYWKQGRYEDAIQLATEATETHRDNRVCIGIYGGTLSYLYGRYEKDKASLREAGYSSSQIAEQREALRLASLDCLKRASEIGSLWLDQAHWGAVYDDPDFQKIVTNSKYPIVFDKMSSREMIGTVTKSFMTQGFKNLFGNKNVDVDADSRVESDVEAETAPIPDE